ncbi:MAG: histone deacetylase [Elusimicrobiota bacterium]
MKLFYSPEYEADIGDHVFPTRKFGLVAARFAGALDIADPGPAPRADLELAHTREWVAKILDGGATLDDEMRMEMPWSQELARSHVVQVAGTYAAGREALATGLGLHAGGGSHHAFAGHGEGFCVFNDLACALLKLRREGRLERAAVIDLDVHQGNGTAAILAPHADLATFSMHQEDIYPLHKPSSSRDIGLPAGTTDDKYLKLLAAELDPFLEEYAPQLVLYQAGVDCWEGDVLGGLRLTRAGVAARDERVFAACFSRGIPAAVTLGGGYAAQLEDTVGLHAATFAAAMECRRRQWRDGT